MGALRKGDKSDGHVTLVIERRTERTAVPDAEADSKEVNIDY
jgi:hypothetical protein